MVTARANMSHGIVSTPHESALKEPSFMQCPLDGSLERVSLLVVTAEP